MKYWFMLLLLLLLPVASANYSNSLLSYWSFDNSTVNTTNATGSGNDASGYWIGTVPTEITSCKVNGCVQFNASASYLNITRGLIQDASDNTYSMSAWIYPTSTSGVWAGTQGGGTTGVNFFLDSAPKVFFNKVGVLNLDYNFAFQNKWTHLVFVQNTTGMYWFANGSLVASNANTANIALSTDNSGGIGRRVLNLGSDLQYYGFIDEIAFWGRALNGTEISELYNGGNGFNPFGAITSTAGFNNVSSAVYTGDRLTTFGMLYSSRNSFNTSAQNFSYSNFLSYLDPSGDGANITGAACAVGNSCGIVYPNTSIVGLEFIYRMGAGPADGLYNVYANGHHALNFTTSAVGTDVRYQLTFNETIQNITLSCTGVTFFNTCFGNGSYFKSLNSTYLFTTTNGTILIPNNLNNVSNFSLFAYSNVSHFNATFTNYDVGRNLTFNYTILKLNGTDYVTGYPVVNYSVALNSTINSYASTQTAVNQSASFFTDNNLSLFLHYAKAGYISNFTTPTGSLDGVYNYTLYFYPNNSVLFSIFNSTNLVPTAGILVDVSLTGSGNNTYYSSTTNGSLFFEGLLPDTYTIDAQAPGFGAFTGSLIVGSNTFQTYAIYLPPLEGTNTIFSIQDFSGGNPIAGATMVTEYKPTLNSSFINIGSYTSDVTGSILLYYTPGAHYRFTLSAPSYQTRQFELDPIIFSTYDITLTRNVTTNVTDDFDSITITIAPSVVYNARTSNFTFYVATPLGNLQGFNYSIWSDSNTTRLSGLTTSAYGDTLLAPYYVNASARGEKVYIEYTYYLTSGTVKTYLRIYPITDYNAYTFNQVSEFDNYGLPLFDRMFIVMMVLLFGAGFAFAFGGEVVAGFISILVLVYFSFIGFIPLWFSAIATFIILWFVWSRT